VPPLCLPHKKGGKREAGKGRREGVKVKVPYYHKKKKLGAFALKS